MSEQQPIARRRFLQTSLAAAGAAGLASGTAAGAAPRARASKIPTRPFGKTGITLPVFGMGGSAMVDKWAAGYGVELSDRDARAAMVRHAFDRGVRYFDTARVYSESEGIMGRGLKGVRDQAFVATKVAVFTPADVRKSLETSLEQLGTDHVELVQLHSPAIERLGFEGSMKIHAELGKLRDEKLCKFIGLTTHVAFENVYKMIATGGFDQVLLAYGYFNKGMDTMLSDRNLEFRNLCLTKANEMKMAIVAMKVFGASIFGHNAKNVVADYDPARRRRLPGAAIRWVLRDERISMLNLGISATTDIDENVATLTSDVRFTPDDRLLLADFSQRAYESDPIRQMRTV